MDPGTSYDGQQDGELQEPRLAGPCYTCGEDNHMKADCPNKPVEICRNCGESGHRVAECEGKRALAFDNIPDKTVDEAWDDLIKADKERDLDDLRAAIQTLQKAHRDLTYAELEAEFRTRSMKTHVIAYEKDITDTFTLMDLDGSLGRKYHIGYFFSANAPRGSLKDSWPQSPEENTERLQNAGFPVDSMIPKCSNCGELGHISKSCKEEKQEREKVEIKCVICKEVGHRARDCTQERIDKFACRNCKQTGHNAKECPEPRSAEGVECKHCNEVGHFAKDCPTREPETCRNCLEEGHKARDCEKPRVEKCRNCDEIGHLSKECPKPRDWSRVKCSNCGEMGHGRGRCKPPPKEENEEENMDSNAPTTGHNTYSNNEGQVDNGWNAAAAAGNFTSVVDGNPVEQW